MLIELSELNLKLLLPLIFPIFFLIENYSKTAYIVNDNHLFLTFRYFLSYIFAGIFFLIFKIRNRKSASEKINSMKDDEIEGSIAFKELEKERRKKNILRFLFLIVLCGVGMFCQYYRKLFEKDEYSMTKQSVGIFFEIISLATFSYFILHLKLYKHHFISLSIITLFLVIFFLASYSFMENILFSCLYFLGYAILYCLYDVLKKKYMDLYFNTPYFMMLIVGSINATILLIFEIIAYFANPDISGIIIGFNDNINGVGDFFLFVLDLILECIWNLGFWITIYYFSPCYNFISEYIAEFIFFIKNATEGNNDFYSTENIIIFTIGFIINFCCIFIFNEVVILNFCKMDYNTKKRIQQRERNESDPKTMISLECLTKEEGEEDEEVD